MLGREETFNQVRGKTVLSQLTPFLAATLPRFQSQRQR